MSYVVHVEVDVERRPGGWVGKPLTRQRTSMASAVMPYNLSSSTRLLASARCWGMVRGHESGCVGSYLSLYYKTEPELFHLNSALARRGTV